jgi:hypothetical protein
LFTMCVEMARCKIDMTLLNSLGFLASSSRSGMGKL